MKRKLPFSCVLLLLSTSALAAPPPAPWAADRVVPIERSAANKAVRLTVVNASLTSHYGNVTAPDGHRFLVLSTRWATVKPAAGGKAPDPYVVPALADQLHVASGAASPYPLAAGTDSLPGALPQSNFTVAPGASVRGNLIFDLPATGSVDAMQLRLDDDAQGAIVVPVQGT